MPFVSFESLDNADSFRKPGFAVICDAIDLGGFSWSRRKRKDRLRRVEPQQESQARVELLSAGCMYLV